MWGRGGWVLELTTAITRAKGMRITEMDFDLAGRSVVLFRRPDSKTALRTQPALMAGFYCTGAQAI